jgi:hypothetical protein
MSRNGSGSYSLPSGNPVNNGTTIDPNWANNTMTDIATSLTQSISQDGQTPITNNLPMTGFRHINVANAQNRNEYASAAQCQDNTFEWLTSVSGTDTITALAAIGMGAYAAGQCFRFVSSGANTTTSVTLNLNGLGAKAITKNGATALAVGDIPSGAVVEVVYDGTQFQLVGTSVNHASTADSATSATSLTGTSTSNILNSALGSGTADNTTYLRGDRTFQTISTMTATTGGLVPTPPNDVTQFLRGNGTFGAVSSLGRLYNITRYSTAGSGTYTKPANINRILVRAIGGGGGGGGTSSGGAGGGGSGGYGDIFITSPAASYAYTVGAAGTGGAGSGTNGGNGGATTIAGISAGGGNGGTGGTGSGGVGGAGGSTSGGGANMRGGAGSSNSSAVGGNGGNCVLAGGGGGGSNSAGTVGTTGSGGGGSGGTSVAGGIGGAGYIEIWEFE